MRSLEVWITKCVESDVTSIDYLGDLCSDHKNSTVMVSMISAMSHKKLDFVMVM